MYNLKLDAKTKDDLEKFNNNETPSKENLFVDIVDDNKFFVRLVLDVQVLAPIFVSDYGHSVLCKIVNSDQFAKVSALETLISEEPLFPAFKHFLKEDTFFLKLSVKDGKYKPEFDVPMDVSKPEDSVIKPGAPLTIFCKAGAWINFKEDVCGLFLKTEKINTVEQPLKKKSRAPKK